MLLNNNINIYYTAGDTFKRVAIPEIAEEGSKLRFQIAKIEGGEPIINKTFPINSDGEYDIMLDDSETARLPVDSEYVYRLTQFNIDGEILTKTSGQFFIIWGSADVEDKIYIGATPEKKLLLKINDLTNELKTVKNDVIYNNEELRAAIETEVSSREQLKEVVNDKVDKVEGLGLSSASNVMEFNSKPYVLFKILDGVFNKMTELKIYDKKTIDDMLSSVGGNSFDLMTLEEFSNLQGDNAPYEEYEGKAIEALAMAVYEEALKDHVYRIEVLENQIGSGGGGGSGDLSEYAKIEDVEAEAIMRAESDEELRRKTALTANLFDNSRITEKMVINSSGVETTNSQYSTTDYIFLLPGDYIVTRDSSTGPSYLCTYDINKKFIKRADILPTIASSNKFNMSNAGYVRLSGYINNMRGKVMLVKGTSLPDDYIPYKTEIDGDELKNYSVGMNKTTFIKPGENLINHRTIQEGYVISEGAKGKKFSELKTSNSQYAISDVIPLKQSTDYTYKNLWRISVFDMNNNWVANYSRSYEDDNPVTFTTPAYDVYAVATFATSPMYDTRYQLNEGNTLKEYSKHHLIIDGYILSDENFIHGGVTSAIKNWNKLVIDKSDTFTLSQDVTETALMPKSGDEITGENVVKRIYDRYETLREQNPDYITKTPYNFEMTLPDGTVVPQTIWRYDFVDPNRDADGKILFENDKAKIILSSGTHCEYNSINGLYHAMKEITNNPDLVNIRRNTHFIIIPVLNPYAVVNWVRTNANGVDIARNFEVEFTKTNKTKEDGTPNPLYSGETPLSEAESGVLDTILKENQDAIYYASCHSFADAETFVNHFMWSASATRYVQNIGGKVVDKLSRCWRQKYDSISDELHNILGRSDMDAPGGSEGKQATKYGIQGGTFEVGEYFRQNSNDRCDSFAMSRAAEVYINLITVVCECYDYRDKYLE